MSFRMPASYYDPPPMDQPDEPCDGCNGDLGDTVYSMRGSLYCEMCVELPERCDVCACWRCECKD